MSSTTVKADVPSSALIPFLGIAFGLAWGIFTLFVLAPEPIERLFGPLSSHHPLFILAVYAPAIAAVALVLWSDGGTGLRAFLSRLGRWRAPPGWYLFLLLGIPAIYSLGALAKGNLFTDPIPFSSFGALLSATAFMLVLGPMEEIGWRGMALPILQRHLRPVWAGALLGAIWGVWHLPAFVLSGTPQSQWGFLPFLAGSIAVSLILTPLFNRSGGSILLAALFHFQLNNPLFPDAQPYDTIFFAAAALAVILLNRTQMFSRDHAVTRVLP